VHEPVPLRHVAKACPGHPLAPVDVRRPVVEVHRVTSAARLGKPGTSVDLRRSRATRSSTTTSSVTRTPRMPSKGEASSSTRGDTSFRSTRQRHLVAIRVSLSRTRFEKPGTGCSLLQATSMGCGCRERSYLRAAAAPSVGEPSRRTRTTGRTQPLRQAARLGSPRRPRSAGSLRPCPTEGPPDRRARARRPRW